jgi:uncharacterized protein
MKALDIAGPAGRLEADLMTPEGLPRASAVLCHAHPLQGGTMHFRLLFRVAKALREEGFSVLRFHFRGVGRSEGAYDGGRGEREDARAAVDFLAREFPGIPLLLGGFSFGAATALREGADERVRALLLMGLPVGVFDDLDPESPAGRPVLFVQANNDEFGDGSAIERFAASCPEPKKLVLVRESDHLFTGRVDEVARAVSEWVRAGLVPTL